MTSSHHNSTVSKRIAGVYLISDNKSGAQLYQQVSAAIDGGVQVVQFRDKQRRRGDKLPDAVALRQLCHKTGTMFIINDDIELARQCNADGVHLGQQDGSVAAARSTLGTSAVIGVSTRTTRQALKAQMDGADYIGVGSIYPTGTKQDAVHIGVDKLREIRRAVQLPIVAIGGIDASNMDAPLGAGADAVAVVSAIMDNPAPIRAAHEMALQFRRRQPLPCGSVLSVAGSDSGGGAGIQADIKTITLLGGYASSAITAVTAQNTCSVTAIHPLPADFVRQQMETVLDDIAIDVIKTGMLHNGEIITTVADIVRQHKALTVIDPVMVATSGDNLFQHQALLALREQLLPGSYLLTPNIPEAEKLCDCTITSVAAMEKAARTLHDMGAANVLLKGGHLAAEPVDVLLYGDKLHHFCSERIPATSTHGTGCTSAAAIATLLAQGQALPRAVALAKQFISSAIATAIPIGGGHGPVNHYSASRKLADQLNCGRHH